MEPSSPWKRPDEVMKLHRLRKKKKALQERMRQPATSSIVLEKPQELSDNVFSRLLDADKRKNPFLKNNDHKRVKLSDSKVDLDETNDNTLFELLNLPAKTVDKPAKPVDSDKLSTFSNLLQKYNADHNVEPVVNETRSKHLPIDWALKTKLRLMSSKPFAWSQQLKACEEASGITGFVRCVDTSTSPTLDTCPRSRFHQACLYWQHPHLPWLSVYPRANGKVAATSFLATNEDVKQALHTEWTESFRSLFQLVRARHCPYFYVCAGTMTCLFRAGGVCGVGEPCALIAPTTRGFRQTLRAEDVEFTMPLRPQEKKKLNTSDSKDEDRPKSSSFDSCYDTMDEGRSQTLEMGGAGGGGDEEGEDEEMDDQFLSQLGLESEVMKKINNMQSRITNNIESKVDSAAESLVFVRGADAQALFNFLLNCKSIVSPTGPLAGVPPTLLAPTAFHGGTLQSLKVRESAVYSDNTKYHSIELRGPILPSTLHTLFRVLTDSTQAHFSATFAHLQHTLAFSYAHKHVADDESTKENEQNHFTKAFHKENLSDCGLSDDLLRHFCSSDPNVVIPLDSVKYNLDDGTYSW